ncbi:hypothetical protein AMTR_s00105p00077090 [Amborella trichopoda]|uniref:Uncharacterized protein n=1 Tax=Amborella trichopoda TaxID=13333 RepID=W1NZB2_AMBTC|nr:hypothetical protein AMTR_s00105p00077090 [Amborella trichopoda]
MVEGEVGEPIALVAQPSHQSLLAYFAVYASEDLGEMDNSESRADIEVGDSRNRENRPTEIVEDDDNGKVSVMFEDMEADFNVPIGIVLEEMKAKKKQEKLQKTK